MCGITGFLSRKISLLGREKQGTPATSYGIFSRKTWLVSKGNSPIETLASSFIVCSMPRAKL